MVWARIWLGVIIWRAAAPVAVTPSAEAARAVLRDVFGFPTFRPGQAEAVARERIVVRTMAALSEALKSAPQGLLKREERDELKGVVIKGVVVKRDVIKGDDLNRGGAIKGRAIKSEGDAHLRRA